MKNNMHVDDQTVKSFSLLYAQRSFHDDLLRLGLRGTQLIEIINLHAKYLTECFLEFGCKGKVDIIHSDPELAMNYIQDRVSSEIAKMISDKIKIQVTKTRTEISYETRGVLMTSDRPPLETYHAPIFKDFEL